MATDPDWVVSKVFMAASNAWWSFENLILIVIFSLKNCTSNVVTLSVFSMIDGQGSNYILSLPVCDRINLWPAWSMQNKCNWGKPNWIIITFLFLQWYTIANEFYYIIIRRFTSAPSFLNLVECLCRQMNMHTQIWAAALLYYSALMCLYILAYIILLYSYKILVTIICLNSCLSGEMVTHLKCIIHAKQVCLMSQSWDNVASMHDHVFTCSQT